VKILLRFIGFGLIIVGLTGCSFIHRTTTTGAAILPAYSGPKVRIAVAEFDVKAAKAMAEVGSSVREMLIAALIDSNRFSIVERQQGQSQAAQGQEPVSGSTAAASAEPQKGTAKSPDLIITGAVTEFEPQASGGRAGVGGGGGSGSGVLGGLLGSALNKAHMGLDISIVDTSTSKTLAATHIQGQASDVSGTVRGGGSFGSGGLGAGLSAYANTPMEKAIRICIIETVRYMNQSIPLTYYKYNSDGKT